VIGEHHTFLIVYI